MDRPTISRSHPVWHLVAAVAALHLFPFTAWADTSIYEPGIDPGVGFNMISWWNDPNGVAVWENALQDVYDAGFRHVSISPVRYFNRTTGAIAASSSAGPELSHIAAGIARAKSLGMTVTVNPFVEPVNFTAWRGSWGPAPGSAKSNTFWADYEQYLVDVATVAQAHGADRMTIGTELRALTRNTGNNAKWASAIGAVDAAFSGQLGYASDWTNFDHSNVTGTIWENSAIDFIGIDAYFPLATNAEADGSGSFPADAGFIATVESSWDDLLDSVILPFADARKGGAGMPVVFTEHGLIPYNRTTTQPSSDSFGTGGQPVDQDERLAGYQALLNAIDGLAATEDLLEVDFWQWGMVGADESFWYTNTDAVNENAGKPFDRFDESLGNVAGQFLSDFVNIFPELPDADFDGDGDVDADDIGDLCANLTGSGVPVPPGSEKYDLDGDGDADQADMDMLIHDLVETSAVSSPGTEYGDFDLDGDIDTTDLTILATNLGVGTTWAEGNANCDLVIDTTDLAILATNFGFVASGAVPEPITLFLMGCGAIGLLRRHRGVPGPNSARTNWPNSR